MKYGLSEKQLAKIGGVFSQYPQVERGVLFGSRVMGKHKNASDVDIAIEGESVDWNVAAAIKTHFEYSTLLPFFFDIVAYSSIKSEELKEHIKEWGAEIYRKEET